MSPRTSKVWIAQTKFDGVPKLSDFALLNEEIRDINDGELICEAEYLSIDPYMRTKYQLSTTMIGTQVAKVIESKNDKYPVGSYIYGHFGWRTLTLVTDPDNSKVHPIKPYPCPNFGDHPRSLALGCCGRTGNSAYFGFLELCKPKIGAIVVISGAAGAVGCLVGQIAKIKGCTTIGIAGTDEKCEWLVRELGFDHCINYKNGNIEEQLLQYAPDGIDCYFDNVGGIISYHVINQMRNYGRISVCGAISGYNSDPQNLPKVPQITNFHRRYLRMEGFQVNRWLGQQWFEGINQMYEWVKDGKIKYQETITHGFDNMPQAFIDIFHGVNLGKSLVKV